MVDIAKLGIEVQTNGATRAKSDLNSLANSAEKTETRFSSLAKIVGGFAIGATIGRLTSSAIDEFRKLDTALAETSTLLQGTPEQMDSLKDSAISLAKAYGGDAASQVDAFYQAISAGAGSVEGANKVVEQANKLAIGGVTDVQSSVDVLTTVVNSYGAEAINATKASDILFTTVKLGKTTASELASTLSGVLPTAQAVGVSFEEVGASVAALTSKGIPTSQAVTSLNQALAGVLKPTSEASKLSKELGLEFDTQALSAKGLVGFLKDVAEKTGGSTEQLTKLFGSVDAQKAVLSLLAGDMQAVTTNLETMNTAAGATDEAYKKVADSLDHRLSVATSSLKTELIGAGGIILAIVVPALEWLANNTEILIPILGGLAAAVGVLTVAMLANPIGLFVTAVAALSGAAIALYQNWDVLVEKFPFLETVLNALLLPIDLIKGAFAIFTGDIDTGVGIIQNALNSMGFDVSFAQVEAAVNIAKDAFGYLGEKITNTIDIVKNMIGIVVSLFNGDFAGAFEGGKQVVAGFANTMIADLANAGLDSIKAMAAAVIIGMQNLASDMVGMAGEIVNGLVKGIQDKIGDLKGAVTGMADATVGWFKTKLGIASPSKVFTEFGGWISQGLANGIDADANLAVGAASKLADTTTNSFKGVLDGFIDDLASGDFIGAFKNAFSSISEIAVSSFTDILKSGQNIIGQLSNSFASLKDVGSSLMSGVSGLFSGGGLGGFAGLGSALSGAMPMIGGLTSLFSVAKGIFSGFSKTTKETLATGVELGIGTDGVSGQSYEDIKKTKSRFWGLSKKTSTYTDYSALDEDTASEFNGIVDGIRDQTSGLFLELGLGISQDAINGVSAGTAKLDSEAAISEYFQDYTENIVGTLTGSTIEALTGLRDANSSLALLGKEFTYTNSSLAAVADLATGLVGKFGGSDAMSSAALAYYDAFYTDAEKLDDLKASLSGAFGDLGLQVPDTMDAFRALVDAQDLMTESGQDAYKMLLTMSPAFETVSSAASDAVNTAADAFESLRDEVEGIVNGALNVNYDAFSTSQKAEEYAAKIRQDEIDATGTTNELLAQILNELGAQSQITKNLARRG